MAEDWNWVSPSGFVRIHGDNATISADSKAECRVGEKEVRLVRQQLVIDRRQIDADIREWRARWKNTGRVSGEEPGFWGSITGSFAVEEKSRFDQGLIALQRRREFLISKISEIDRVILAIKQHALSLEASQGRPALPPPSSCSSCGAAVKAGASFCGQCGNKL